MVIIIPFESKLRCFNNDPENYYTVQKKNVSSAVNTGDQPLNTDTRITVHFVGHFLLKTRMVEIISSCVG